MKTQSSELQRIAEEAVNNEKRLAAYRMKTTLRAYNNPDFEIPEDPWWTAQDQDTEWTDQ